jgi:hypothetical protein
MHWLVEAMYTIHHCIICIHYVRGKTPLLKSTSDQEIDLFIHSVMAGWKIKKGGGLSVNISVLFTYAIVIKL